MAVQRNYRLNLRNYGNPPVIMISQYDEGYNLVFTVYDGSSAADDLSAYTVKLRGVRSDTLSYEFTGTVSSNVMTIPIDTTMSGCAGRGTAEIAIIDTANNVLFATFNMLVYVEKAAVPDDAVDADVERAEEIAAQVQEIVDTAAATVEASLGTLSNLTTDDKTSVVAAINEVDANTDALKSDLTRVWKQDLMDGVGIIDGSFMHNGGSIETSATSCVTGFIPVLPNTKYRASKVFLTYYRSIYAYDKTRTGMESLISGSSETTVEFTTPANCAFVRMTGKAGVRPELVYAENAAGQNIDIVKNSIATLAAEALKISEKATNDNVVFPSCLFEVGGISFASDGYTYGSNYKRIRMKEGITFDLPAGSIIGLTDYTDAKYAYGGKRSDGTYGFVYNCTSDRLITEDFTECVVVIYPITERYLAEPDVADLSSRLFVNHRHFTQSAPQLTIIDDDTLSIAHVTKFYEQCNIAGIKGTFATEPYYLENTQGLPELLKSYEEAGFQCAYHCYKQTNIYRSDSQYRDFAAMEADFVKGLDKMNEYRFGNFRYFVAPYGSKDSALQGLARKWGMQCLVSIAQNYYETQSVVNNRWFIPRIGLNQHDSDGAVSLAQLKEQMALCASDKGWLLIGTHFNEWDEAEGYSRFHEVVDYAETLGFKIVTLAEGFENWRTNYDYKELHTSYRSL